MIRLYHTYDATTCLYDFDEDYGQFPFDLLVVLCVAS